jgi:adenosylmethionine-8-amino-7-oxononanoate aminotransferase
VRGMGLLQAIEVVQDRDTLATFAATDTISNRIVAKGIENGVFFYGGGTGEVRDIVCMGPPFTINESHIDTMVEVLLKSVDAVT